MKVSIICAFKYRLEHLKRCMQSWSRITYPNYEFIIADDGSDEDVSVLMDYFAGDIKNLRHIRLEGAPDRTPAPIWMEGYKQCDGDYVIFTGNDLILSDYDMVERMIESSKDERRTSVVTMFLSKAETAQLDEISWLDNPRILETFPGFWGCVEPLITGPSNQDRKNGWGAAIISYLTGAKREFWDYIGPFRVDNTHLICDQDLHLREKFLNICSYTVPEVCAYHQAHGPAKFTHGVSRIYQNERQARLLEEAPYEK